jgi:hypothetical protein
VRAPLARTLSFRRYSRGQLRQIKAGRKILAMPEQNAGISLFSRSKHRIAKLGDDSFANGVALVSPIEADEGRPCLRLRM